MGDLFYLATDLFSKGGIERYSRAQISALKEIFPDTQITVYSYNPPDDSGFESTFPVDFKGEAPGLLRKARFTIRVIRQALKINPRIIWVNHIHLMPIAFLSGLLNRRIKLVLNIYGLEIWSGLSWLQRISLKKADLVISDSGFTRSYVEENLNVKPDKMLVIWDPVDTNRFYPKKIDQIKLRKKYELPDRDASLVLMILGRISVWSRHKGYDRLLDLMRDLKGEDIILVIGGDGDDLVRLKNRTIAEGLEKRTFFTGSIHEDDLADIYQLADIFILVSDRGVSKGEGVPLTPLEAAACGKPIIVGNEDGSQEAVWEGKNGYIVSPHDPGTLKMRVLELYHDPQLRSEMGQNARQIIETEFSYPVFLKKHKMAMKHLFER